MADDDIADAIGLLLYEATVAETSWQEAAILNRPFGPPRDVRIAGC